MEALMTRELHTGAGTVMGCLRKLQRWSLTAIFEEYRRYAGTKVRLLNEQVFYTSAFRI